MKSVKVKKIIAMVAFLAICLTTFAVGVTALAKSMQFSISTKYNPQFQVEVQMQIDGEYKQIFSSQNPAEVNYNAYYINNVTSDTIVLENDKLASTVNLKIISHDTENYVACYINQAQELIFDKATAGNSPEQTASVAIGEITDQSTKLGVVKIDIKFAEAPSYTIAFDANGGSEVTQTITAYKTFAYGTLPTAPIRDNYTFLGWFTDPTGGEQITAESIANISANQTLYAHWQANAFAITYNLTGCTATTKPTEIMPNGSAEIVLTAESDEHTTWNVKVNGEDANATIDYIPSLTTATFTISNPTENINIEVSASKYWDGKSYSSGDRIFSGGTGLETDPYIIRNAFQLTSIDRLVSNYYKLGNNIYLNDETFENLGNGYVKVSDGIHTAYLGDGSGRVSNGTYSTLTQMGQWYSNTNGTTGLYAGILNTWTPIRFGDAVGTGFDGSDYEISGIYINTTSNNQGLFDASVTTCIEIQNVKTVNGYIKGGTSVGGVFGNENNALQGCNVIGCTNTCTILGTDFIGGIVGDLFRSANITGCTNEGVVSGVNSIGGIAGRVRNGGLSCISCNNKGTVSGSGEGIGGIVGASGTWYPNSIANDCHNTGKIYGKDKVGGIWGNYVTGTAGISNCTTTNTYYGITNVGNMWGYLNYD